MTLGHTFSYIVSLPVSENVSGVAILAEAKQNSVRQGLIPARIARLVNERFLLNWKNHRQIQAGSDPFATDLPAAAETISAGQHACLNRVRASIDQRSHIYLTAQLRCSNKRERFCRESQLSGCAECAAVLSATATCRPTSNASKSSRPRPP